MSEVVVSPWGEKEKQDWYQRQQIKRSYQSEVVAKLQALSEDYELTQYGALSIDPDRYPLWLLKSKPNPTFVKKPTVLITGGVHGYETSGVQGAIRFMQQAAKDYADTFNFICAPCVSPWGYETINRWNAKAIDPNRSFYAGTPAEESALLMQAIAEECDGFIAHFDLHETTDTDNSVFLPDLAARDASELIIWEIPDGFYTVGDSDDPKPAFQQAVIDSVAKVTHIAPADEHGCIIGEKMTQPGVINYPVAKLHLCAGLTTAEYRTTTEVYPDSPKVTDEECILAQVAALRGGLDFIKSQNE